jgi:uncharacterized protein
MSGVTDLSKLLQTMQPTLVPGEFVFCSISESESEACLSLKPLGLFREAEGVTMILPASTAFGRGLAHSAPMRLITLKVHSSLEAVGLTAAVATALTREGISANVVAAFYHDHIFVPAADAKRAVAALEALTSSASTSDRGE